MTLLDVIETAIADAVRAGAEWHAIVQCRQNSAEVGRQQRQWVQDLRSTRGFHTEQGPPGGRGGPETERWFGGADEG